MKVAMLGPYPTSPFKDRLKLSKWTLNHPCTWIVNLNHALANLQGIDLHMITRAKGLIADQIIKSDGITYHFLVQRPSGKYSKMLALFQLDKKRIHRELKVINPDVIHSHGTESVYSYVAVTSGYPCIVSLQGVINKIIEYETDIRTTLNMKVLKYFERYTIRRAKYINAKTPYAFNCVKDFISNSKIFYIEDPVSERYFGIQNYEKENRILFVGTIIKRKGIEDLIQSVYLLKEKIRNIKLRIIGWGHENYQNQILDYINNNNLQANVDFLGFKNSEEIADELSKSCLLVLPSYIENCPNVILEAMATGKPVIATRVGGIPYIVKDGITGFLVDAGDINALTRSILQLMEDKDLRIKMGVASREAALKRFHPDIVTKRHMEIYKEVIEEWPKL